MTTYNLDEHFADITNFALRAIVVSPNADDSISSLVTPIPDDQTANQRKVLELILQQQPDLMLEGFRCPSNAHLWPDSRQAMLTNEHHVNAFIDCRLWLQKFPKQDTFNKISTSYGFKHVMQRDTGAYASNGVFIAAAMTEGFKLQRVKGESDVWLNIKYEPKRRV